MEISVKKFSMLEGATMCTRCVVSSSVKFLTCVCLFLVVASTPAGAQADAEAESGTPVRIARLTGPIELDGSSAELAWQAITPLPLTMYQPVYQGEMSEQSEVRVAYDDSHLYVAGRFYDSEPAGIRVNSLYRDRSSGDDLFGIVIDAFDDNENGLWFWTNPAGVRGDATISDDANGPITNSWNTYWDVATEQTDDGWFVEMRIPFSSLGFQATGDAVVMGITAYRYLARRNERHVFPAISPSFSYLRPSKAQRVLLDDVHTERPIYFTPYALGGVGQVNEFDQTAQHFEMNSDGVEEIGLDVKYNVTSNLTLDLTVNTDFAQVEADDRRVNLTRFSLFFPERRQFFQERAGIFDFSTGNATRLFHTRRIGLDGEGERVRILGGARLIGRVGDWDVGLINMQTARREGLPSENFGVYRLRRQVFNEHSHAGGMVTMRLDEDGGYNVAVGGDGVFRVVGENYLTVRLAQTVDDALVDADAYNFTDAGVAYFTISRRSAQGLRYFVQGRWFGEDYRPGMGFTTRQNTNDVFGGLWYSHFFTGDEALRQVEPFQLFGQVVRRNDDGTVESAFIEHDFDFHWRSGASLGADLEVWYEDLPEPLSFPEETVIPGGSYWFFRHEGYFDTPDGNLFWGRLDWGIAGFYDGWRVNFGISPRWNVSRFLELGGVYQADFIRFPDRNQGFDAHIVRFRIQAAVNTKLSGNAFIQFSNLEDQLSANFRLRYNFREGNDLWLVYDEGWNTDRGRVTPNLPITNNRTILLKYTYTWGT